MGQGTSASWLTTLIHGAGQQGARDSLLPPPPGQPLPGPVTDTSLLGYLGGPDQETTEAEEEAGRAPPAQKSGCSLVQRAGGGFAS